MAALRQLGGGVWAEEVSPINDQTPQPCRTHINMCMDSTQERNAAAHDDEETNPPSSAITCQEALDLLSHFRGTDTLREILLDTLGNAEWPHTM